MIHILSMFIMFILGIIGLVSPLTIVRVLIFLPKQFIGIIGEDMVDPRTVEKIHLLEADDEDVFREKYPADLLFTRIIAAGMLFFVAVFLFMGTGLVLGWL